MRLSSFRRVTVLAICAVALAGTSACFGSFNLTRKVWRFNKDVSKEKFVQELVFLGFNIVPVYGVAGFIDAVIVNSVEFWTGKNPVEMTSNIRLDNSTNVQRVSKIEKDGARTMTVKLFKFDKLVATTKVRYMPGTRHVAFETTLADGTAETYVAMMNADGSASVVSGTYAELPRIGAKAGF